MRKPISENIKTWAQEIGFSDICFSNITHLEKQSDHLKQWLNKNFHGEMSYMENHFEKRTNPAKLVDGAKTVISVLLNYYPEKKQSANTYKISKYAYGKDYHYVLKDKLHKLLEQIQLEFPETTGRAFVDSAPVMDKAWAVKAGLGWQAKNSNVISRKLGSFVFIGELIIDLDLSSEIPDRQDMKNYCGNCTRCIDACPTNALTPYTVDARKCISYLTIEKKGDLPSNMQGKWSNWIFGCDICQDVCPWNSKLTPHNETDFIISDLLQNMNKADWQNMDKAFFKKTFKNTALERTKFEGIKRNIEFLNNKKMVVK